MADMLIKAKIGSEAAFGQFFFDIELDKHLGVY
jgi:hypothetical protein